MFPQQAANSVHNTTHDQLSSCVLRAAPFLRLGALSSTHNAQCRRPTSFSLLFFFFFGKKQNLFRLKWIKESSPKGKTSLPAGDPFRNSAGSRRPRKRFLHSWWWWFNASGNEINHSGLSFHIQFRWPSIYAGQVCFDFEPWVSKDGFGRF